MLHEVWAYLSEQEALELLAALQVWAEEARAIPSGTTTLGSRPRLNSRSRWRAEARPCFCLKAEAKRVVGGTAGLRPLR